MKMLTTLAALVSMLLASMVAVAEGPTVYGRVAFGLTSESGEEDEDDKDRLEDFLGSRLGVKGTNDLGNGMTVDYLLEYGAGESMSLRHSNLTLNGSFGQFRLGKQTGVLYRYIGANIDQSWGVGGKSYYQIAKTSTNSNHGLRMSNIAAYRFGAGPGGDDPITFDIQIQSVDQSTKDAVVLKELPASSGDLQFTADNFTVTEAADDDESIDSVTIGAATALGPVKFQVAYVDENGSDATGDRSPSLLSFGFRAPLGSAEIRGHMTEVDADTDMRGDDEAWGLLVMNDFGGGYFGMIGVGNYEDGAQEVVNAGADGDINATDDNFVETHGDAGDLTDAYVSLTKSFGGGLSAIAEYRTVSKTKSTVGTADTPANDDKEKMNTFLVSLLQSF